MPARKNVSRPRHPAALAPATQAQSQNADKARRQQLLHHLVGRLAHAEQQRQAVSADKHDRVLKCRPGRRARNSSSSGQLKHLVAVRGLEDWMQVRGCSLQWVGLS